MKPKLEAWIPIKETNGLYEVSNFGRVRRVNKTGGYHYMKPIYQHRTSKNLTAVFTVNNKKIRKSLASLVFQYFGDCTPKAFGGKSYVLHKDGNRKNNSIDNLYVTISNDVKLKKWQIKKYNCDAEVNVKCVVRKYWDKLKQYRIEYDDLVQDALILIWKYLQNYPENEPFYNFCALYTKFAFYNLRAKNIEIIKRENTFSSMSGKFMRRIGESYEED